MSFLENKNELESVFAGLKIFQREAHTLFAVLESSKSRIVLLDETYTSLTGLSLKQDELFRQALRCVENDLFRAAHVMAWAGFVDFLDDKLASDGFEKLKRLRTAWTFNTVDELRERYTEHARIEALKGLYLISQGEMKIFHGLLSKRNECAHPSSYFPDMNETLGYISELINRIRDLSSKTL